MKKKSLRKTLPGLATLMVVLFMALVFPVSMCVQSLIQHKNQADSAAELFGQFEHLLESNEEDLENERRIFAERCISAADGAAFYIECNKDMMYSLEGTQELAKKLHVDEIHYYTPDGILFSGTHPEYYGLSFYSGKQMRYFLPMLEDRSLKLCQKILPNTAEGKNMQYAAVWVEDGSAIVQIGMEPKRLLHRMEEKSLKNLFSRIPLDSGGYFHIIDKKTGEILVSSNEKLNGLRIDTTDLTVNGEGLSEGDHQRYDGKRHCVYSDVYKDYILVRSYSSGDLIAMILETSLLSLLYVLVGAAMIIEIIRRFIERRIIDNLNRINQELRRIECGDLDHIAIETYVEELDEMLFYINQMLRNIRLNWEKLNYIIDKGDLPIGIYEKNNFYHKAVLNERLLEILGVDGQRTLSEEEKMALVDDLLARIEQCEVDPEEHIYVYDHHGELRYLRLEKQDDAEGVRYYITDMTLWWNELQQAKARDGIDEMTGLYNRRGLKAQLEVLFGKPHELGCAALIMIDADNLKQINDCAGHYAGDEYIKAIANGLREVNRIPSVCARLGGDEFVVFLHHAQNEESLSDAVQAIANLRGETIVSSEFACVQTIEYSMGVAYYPQDSNDYHLLLRIADERMYQEKLQRKQGSLV